MSDAALSTNFVGGQIALIRCGAPRSVLRDKIGLELKSEKRNSAFLNDFGVVGHLVVVALVRNKDVFCDVQ